MTVAVTPQERRLTLAALMAVLLLSTLDQTVVGTAMPRIVAELHGLELISWVTTAYMLTSTVLVPIYGKLGDLYGRKPILIFGVGMFLFGSALCGMAGEFGRLPLLGGGMTQLIVFRGVQGIGGAALFTSTFTIIGDLFSPRERGRVMGVFASVIGFSMVMGPLVGGFFTDHGTIQAMGGSVAGWRLVFYINLPVGLLALFMIVVKMPQLGHKATGRIDLLGAAIFVTSVVPFLLALTWGGRLYAWTSPEEIGLLAVAVAALVAFLLVEIGKPDALIPLALFRNRVFTIANMTAFLVNMAFMGVILFLPLYMQVVQGVDATRSGLSMLPMMAGLIGTSILCGQLSSRTGRYKPFIIAGYVFVMLGVIALAGIGPDTSTADLGWRMFLMGAGLGPTQSLFNVAIQNAVPIAQVGIATSASQFFRQIGSTIGVTLFGAILTGNLAAELPRHVPNIPGLAATKLDLTEAQAQAMNPHRIRDRIEALFDAQYQVIDRAFHGDAAATETVLANPLLPEALKADLRAAGGNPDIDRTLGTIKRGFDDRAAALSTRIERGVKEAFSISIAALFKSSWGIVLLGILVAAFLPELPLRHRMPADAPQAVPAAE